ncbi:MAG: sigma-54-dependent Fis family transcriptional regulator [Myxococcales bacterium]|nr:sigma-54-dependent Fis family transcriptional regulator [Myxococcales bacterium]
MFLRTLIAVEPGEPTRRVSRTLDEVGALARSAGSFDELRQHMAVEPFDLVIIDRAWAHSVKPALISELRELPESPEVIVLLEEEDAELRAELLAAGAYAVLFRELPEELFHQALSALARRRLEETRARLHAIPDEDYRLGDYVTRSPAMQAVLRSARRIAERDTTIMLLGETGVGKGLLARSLHNEGPRSDGPFVAVNCGALTETLLEAELFGHERGAFTGADRARRGYFELAHRGTLFLDEIAEVPHHLQVKLLQVLEERRVRPVGSEKRVDVDIRLIAATNRDLPEEVKQGRFREDLFYRINVVTLTLPPLRERVEDIPEIAESYVEHFRALTASPAKRLSESSLDALRAYPWPGNVRELANAIERAVIMSLGEQIQVEDLAVDIQTMAPESTGDLERAASADLDPGWLKRPWAEVRRQVLEETELLYLRGLLEESRGRIGETASRAGMDPRSLHQKMRKYGLRKEDFRS